MVDAVELATAYINLVPSMQGSAAAIGSELSGSAVQGAVGKAGDKAGKTFSSRMSKAGKIGTAALTLPILAIGAAGLQAGMQVDEAYDTIRTNTGATGKALAGLQKSFDNVAKKTPADMAKVGETVSSLNQRLGLTGPTLEKLSQQILEAGRLGGVDVDVQKVSGAFNAFSVQGADTTKRMDDIFRVSQATGVGINDLAATMAKSGGVLKQLGFGFTESASLLGVLDKAGINSRAVVSSMQAGLVKLAKDGEKPQEAFKRITGELQGFVKSGDDAAALELAGKVFGTRGAGQFIAALKSGKVNLDDLAGSAKLSKDTILGVANETKDFPELWKEFQNSATLALAPIGAKLMPAIGNALTMIAPLLEQFANWFGGLSDQQLMILMGIGLALAAIGPAMWVASKAQAAWTVAVTAWNAITKIATATQWLLNAAMRANPIGLIITAIGLLVGALVWFFTKTKVGQKIVQVAWKGIQTAISAVSRWWTKTAWPAIRRAIDAMVNWFRDARDVVAAVWNGIQSSIGAAWKWIRDNVFERIRTGINLVKLAFQFAKIGIGVIWSGLRMLLRNGWNWIDANVFAKIRAGIALVRLGFSLAKIGIGVIWSGLRDTLRNGWIWINTNVFSPFKRGLGLVGDAFKAVPGIVSAAWNKIRKAAAEPINFVISTVYMKGIKATWDTIADAVGLNLKLPTISPIAFANGSEDHRAQIARGGAMRLWAEPETGGEAYIPLAPSKRGRSTAILGTVASKFGYSLSKYADGGWFGDVWDTIKSTASSIFAGPSAFIKSKILDPITSALSGLGGGVVGKVAGALPKKIIDGLIQKATGLLSSGSDLQGGGRYTGGPVMGWQAMWRVLKNAFPGANLHSAYRPGAITAVGTPSFHGLGRAIDVTPSMAIANWIAKTFPNSTELIYSPMGGRQLYKGQRTLFGEPTRGDHWDHVHWAMANGGMFSGIYDGGGWMPDRGVGMNLSGRPEAVLDPDESIALKTGLGNGPLVGTMVVADPREAIYRLEGMKRRAAVRAGVAGMRR